jgi:hypothetical protein
MKYLIFILLVPFAVLSQKPNEFWITPVANIEFSEERIKYHYNINGRNVLMFYDSLDYTELTQYPSFLKSGPLIPIPAQELSEKTQLKVYPNPASDYFIIRYELDNNYAEARIQVCDMSGKIVEALNLEMTRDYLIVPVNKLNNGVYLVKLVLNGKDAGSQKVNIHK